MTTIEPPPFSCVETTIQGLMILTMKQVSDERGTVREFYRASAFLESGLETAGSWRQINVTETVRGALRGMHAELMTKVVAVASGHVFGAYVDLRKDSGSYGTVFTVTLHPGMQVVVPPGVANGFQSTSDEPSQYIYGFDTEWAPDMAGGAINPLDEFLAIPWPIAVDVTSRSQVSLKDTQAPVFREKTG